MISPNRKSLSAIPAQSTMGSATGQTHWATELEKFSMKRWRSSEMQARSKREANTSAAAAAAAAATTARAGAVRLTFLSCWDLVFMVKLQGTEDDCRLQYPRMD